MKLRLPHRFQAALLAALASVSFTTLSSGTLAAAAGVLLAGQKAQAGSITSVDIEDWEGYDATTGVATLGNTGSAVNHGEFDQPNQGWNSNWNFVIVVDASTLASGTTYDLMTTTLFQNDKDGYINGAKMVVSADGTTATVTNQGWNNNTSGGQEFVLSDVKTLTFVMSREGSKVGNVVLKGYADGNFDNAVVTAAVAGVNLSFSANIRQVNVGALDGLTPHNNVASGAYQVPDTGIGAFGVTKAGYNLNSTLSSQDLLTFYNSVEQKLTWAGSSTNHTWTSGSATEWTGGTFVNGSDVVFDSSASEHVVLVNSAIETGKMKVSDAYTYEVGSNGSLSVGRLSGAGAITKTGSGTLMLSGNNSGFTGAVNVNAGSLDLASSVGVSDLSVASGATLKLAGAGMLSAGNLTLASGSVLDVSNIAHVDGLTVGLGTYTGSASYSGVNLSGMDGFTGTLNAADGVLSLTFAAQPAPTPPAATASLGKVMYVGDSITDGVGSQKSWRYSFFQVLADGGISQVEEGYFQHHQTSHAIPDGQTAAYGGRTFENTHSAQASARSWETAGDSTGRYDNTNIKNWLGQSPTKTGGGEYTGPVYKDETAPDTFFMLLGTNDTLSQDGGHMSESYYNQIIGRMYGYQNGAFDGTSGTFDKIYTSMMAANENARVVVLEIPAWSPNHSNNNFASDFAYIAKVNQKLHEWAASKNNSNITIVRADKGIVDVANTTKPGSGVPSMFSDGLHPSNQGELLMAGNIAQQLGYAGRSVGLDRAAYTAGSTDWHAADSSSITVAVGTPQTFAVDAFTLTDGYTVDFGALYGNGIGGGWDGAWNTSNINGLRVQVGDGTHTGTLTFSEAYVKWGDTVLYSRDNHVAGENFRIAYVNASVKGSDNVSAGYYVWMGDQLIGEALNAGDGEFNGIQLTSTGTSATVSNLTWSDTAYAPTTNRFVNPDENALFHLEQADPNPPHDNTPTRSGVDFTGATIINKQKGIESSSQFSGDAVFVQSDRSSWIAASGVNFDHSITAKIDGGSKITASIFGVQGGTTHGDVTLDISNVTIGDQGTYSGAKAAIAGAFSTANIDGTFTVYVTNSTIGGNIVGGAVGNNGSVGAFELYLNSGSVNGSIYGGPNGGNNPGGTIGDVSITINGGHVTGDINGGAQKGSVTGNSTIVVKGGIIDGNIIGADVAEGKSSTITIESNKPLIGGDITADAVVLKNIAPKGEDDFFDTYAGTITGNTSITLDGYAVQNLAASLVTQTLNLINSSSTTIHDLTLTACEINVESGSSATLADSVTLGNTATYTGDLTLANGLAINVAGMGITGEEKSVNLFTTQSGTLNADASQLTIVGLAQDAPAYHLSNTNNNLVLTFGAQGQDLIWDGSTNSDWSTDQDDLNWHTSASTETHLPFATGDNVTFTSGVTNSPVLQSDIEAGTMTLTNGGSTVTINTNGNNLKVNNLVSADAATDNKFTKTGAGTATFNGNNTAYFDVLRIGADAGTTIFNQHVVQTGTTRFDVSSDVSFLNGYEYTGTQGYGLLVTNSATVTLGGESNMPGKNVGMGSTTANLILEENASLSVAAFLNTVKSDNNGNLTLKPGASLTVNGGEYRAYSVVTEGTILVKDAPTNRSRMATLTTKPGSVSTFQCALEGHTEGVHYGINTFNAQGGSVTFEKNVTIQNGIAASGGVLTTVNNAQTLSLPSLTIADNNTSVEFSGHVVVTGNNRLNVGYNNNDTGNNETITFNDGFDYTGSDPSGYALLIGKTDTVILGGNSDLSGKTVGMETTGTLRLLDNATVTVARMFNSATAGNNGTLDLQAGTEVNITGSSGDSTITNVTGTGAINYTGTDNRTLKLTGNIGGYTGTLDNKSDADLALNLSDSVTAVNMDITHTGSGKVNVALNKDSVTLNGTQLVNNVTQSTNWSAFIGNSGDVTATGKVVTGRLVVGEESTYTDAVFTLSGKDAQLYNNNGTEHTYTATVQGYGTFEVADGATQTLSQLNASNQGFHGTLKATGATSALTLNSALGSGTDLVAENGGKIVLTNRVTSVDAVTVDDSSTLTLSGAITPLSTTGTFSLDGGSTLDLSNYTFSGTDPVTLVTTTGSGTISGPEDWSSVHLTFAGAAPEGAQLAVDAGGNLVLTFTQPVSGRDLIWDGTNGTSWTGDYNWHLASGDADSVVFQDGDNVAFTTATPSVTTVLGAAANAGTMEIENGVAVTVNTNANNLTVHDLDVEGGSLTKTGTGKATFGGSDTEGVSLSNLSIMDGSAEFSEHVTVTGNRVNVAYATQGAKTGVSAVFKDGLDYKGSDSSGYAMVIGYENSVVLGGVSDLGNNKTVGIARDATLELKDGATASVGRVYNSSTANNNGTLKLGEGSTFSITNANAASSLTNIENNGGTLNVSGGLTVHSAVSGDGEIVYNGPAGKTMQLNGGGEMGKITVTSGDFVTTGAQGITLGGLDVQGGTAHVGNSGAVDLGDVNLTGGALVLNTDVTATSLTTTTTGATLTFAGANMLTTSGAIDLSGGATFDLSNIKYSAAESGQEIVLAHSNSGTITLGGQYTFTNPQYEGTSFQLTTKDNNLVLVVTPDVTDWPTGTNVSYTYTVGTGEHAHKETHYDSGTAPHGYRFEQADGGVVEFNPSVFVNDVYTDDHNIVMHSDTTIVVEEGKTVKLTGKLSSENSSGQGISGDLTKDGAGTLEMTINDVAVGEPQQNIYEGSVNVEEGTLHIVNTDNPKRVVRSLLASGKGDHVRVAKDAVLELDYKTGISIPKGQRNNSRPGEDRSLVLSANTNGSTIVNAYISEEGIRPDDAQDGGRALIDDIYELQIGNINDTSKAVTIELADILVESVALNGTTTIDNSYITITSDMSISNNVGAPNKIQNHSTIDFRGGMGWVNNTEVDKTSKINSLNPYTAILYGNNKIEVGSQENGGVAERIITENTISYTSDQYKGMLMYPYDGNPLSLGVTLSDMDLPEDLTGYTFTLTFEGFDTSYIGLTNEFQPIADSDLNVSLILSQYTGGQWEEQLASVQAKFDGVDTVFMFVTPEPTTSTLSLLALAALAARRRRK